MYHLFWNDKRYPITLCCRAEFYFNIMRKVMLNNMSDKS